MHLILSIVLLFTSCSDNETTQDPSTIALLKITKVQSDRNTPNITFKNFQDTGVENLIEEKLRSYNFILWNINNSLFKTFTVTTKTGLQELIDYCNKIILPYERSKELLYREWELKKRESFSTDDYRNAESYSENKEVTYYESNTLAIYSDGTYQEKDAFGFLWEGTFSIYEYDNMDVSILLEVIYFCKKTRNGMYVAHGENDCYTPFSESYTGGGIVKIDKSELVIRTGHRGGIVYYFYEVKNEINEL